MLLIDLFRYKVITDPSWMIKKTMIMKHTIKELLLMVSSYHINCYSIASYAYVPSSNVTMLNYFGVMSVIAVI